MAFDVNEFDGVFGDFVLELALVNGVFEIFDFLHQFVGNNGFRREEKDDDAGDDGEDVAVFAQDVKACVVKMEGARSAKPGEIDVVNRAEENRGQQNHKRDEEHAVIELPGFEPDAHPMQNREPKHDEHHGEKGIG